MLALIGGSGFFSGPGVLTDTETVEIDTPTAPPRRPSCWESLAARLSPSFFVTAPDTALRPTVPYRANLWALKKLGVEGVVGVATVGGIAGPLGPGGIAVPDQLIDYTWGREVTYYDRPEAGVKHVDMTHPFDRGLREELIAAAAALGKDPHDGGAPTPARRGRVLKPRRSPPLRPRRRRHDQDDALRVRAGARTGSSYAGSASRSTTPPAWAAQGRNRLREPPRRRGARGREGSGGWWKRRSADARHRKVRRPDERRPGSLTAARASSCVGGAPSLQAPAVSAST